MINVSFKDFWPAVIEALETGIPYYESVGERISLWHAQSARRYAALKCEVQPGMSVLDVGIGPGALSKIVLSRFKPGLFIGLDVSTKMLKVAAENLSRFYGSIQTVRGIFEKMPFREGSFDRVFSAFALEDSPDRHSALREFGRVCKRGGLLAIVNIGKSDNRVIRSAMAGYINFIMPTIAKLSILRKISGNPWRLLTIVYQNLPTNSLLKNEVKDTFGEAFLKKFMFGGIIVLWAKKKTLP
ncbi:MAG: class I SAM-dependent methyltransferase [Candidatus Geothermarchaeales archaeon]